MLQTPRLVLRRFEEKDLHDLYTYLSDPEVVKYEPYKPLSLEETRTSLLERCQSDEMVAVELVERACVIGNVYLGKRPFDSLELGYVFNQQYWHQGYAQEACEALIQDQFKKGIHRFYAECDPENTYSWKLLERLQFQREAHLHKNVSFWCDDDGNPTWKDTYIYSRLNPKDKR